MREVYDRIARMVREGASGVVATVVRAEGSTPRGAGAKMLIAADGRTWGTVGGGAVEAAVIREALTLTAEDSPRVGTYDLAEGGGAGAVCGGRVEVLLEPLPPAENLFVYGAGHVGRALVGIARAAGFAVTVIDPRPGEGDSLHGCALLRRAYADAAGTIPAGPGTYVVVVTPGHESDEDVVRAELARPHRYVGMIGSRKKVAAFRSRLREEGVPDGVADRLHAPIGLDIGAETAGEIAVSILAELVAVRRGARK